MKYLILIILFASCEFRCINRDAFNDVIYSIDNKDLYIAPVYSNPWGEKKKGINKDSARANKRLFIVSSFNVDIHQAAKKYTKKALFEKLKELLNDSTKDLYANALLYDLFDNRKLGKLINLSRDKWINSGRRDLDIKHWQSFQSR